MRTPLPLILWSVIFTVQSQHGGIQCRQTSDFTLNVIKRFNRADAIAMPIDLRQQVKKQVRPVKHDIFRSLGLCENALELCF